MPSLLATHLADRFAADARGLRARAAALAASPAAGRRGGGPDAASCTRMADACDRMRAFFAEAAETTPDDEALGALLPRLAGLVAGARSPDERNVYAGAVARLTEGLDGDDDEAAQDDEDDEDDE